jgi:hypothetical protein
VAEAFPTRHTFGGRFERMAKTTTPWGQATVVEGLAVQQRAGERRFTSVVELLENDRGERLVRFAYSTSGVGRRGPVTLRLRDVARLHAELAKKPELARALGLGAA